MTSLSLIVCNPRDLALRARGQSQKKVSRWGANTHCHLVDKPRTLQRQSRITKNSGN